MQVMETEQYVQRVRDVGIEQAYAERFRCTGRTVRDILALTTKLSEGKAVIIHSSSHPGRSYECGREVLRRVADCAQGLGMAIWKNDHKVGFVPSGGSIEVRSGPLVGRLAPMTEEYVLHG